MTTTLGKQLNRNERNPLLVNDSIRQTQQVLTGFINQWTQKSADEARNSSSALTSDGDLHFAVAASANYRFSFHVFYDTPAAADFQWQLSGPASPTVVLYNGHAIPPGGSETVTQDTAFSSPHVLTETSGTAGTIRITGILQNGVNAGTVAFQWAQNTSNGSNTKVRAGSWVENAKV